MAALERAWLGAVDRSLSDDISHFLRRREINQVVEYRPPSELRRPDLVLALNRPEDLEVLSRVFEYAPSVHSSVDLADAIAYCDANPDVALRNASYTPVPSRCDTRLDTSKIPMRPEDLQWFEAVCATEILEETDRRSWG